VRCYECGNRVADGQRECPTCHTAFWAAGPAVLNTPASLPTAAHGDSSVAMANQEQYDVAMPSSRGQVLLQQTGYVVAGAASAMQSAFACVIPVKRSVHGRVIIAEAPSSEEPNLDVCQIITRILWIIMLLPFLICAAVICLLFRRFAPINLFVMLGVFKFLNPVARNKPQVPVRFFRVREDGSDAEVMVRMKGQYTHGNIGLEDLVTLSGRSRGGTLRATHGYNHRTASTIRLARSYSWVGLVLTLLFIFTLVVKFHEPTVRVTRTINSIRGAR